MAVRASRPRRGSGRQREFEDPTVVTVRDERAIVAVWKAKAKAEGYGEGQFGPYLADLIEAALAAGLKPTGRRLKKPAGDPLPDLLSA